MKTRLVVLCTALFLLNLFFLFCHILSVTDVSETNVRHSWESFEPGLVPKLQSVADLLFMADQRVPAEERHTLRYYNVVNDLVQRRFYHGFSHYSLSTNPLAFLAGRVFRRDFSAIVLPDDIMKHPMAACSQQSIVLMEVFKRRGIPFRKIGFDHHFTLEGKIDGQWYFFDPDMEPRFPGGRQSLAALSKEGNLYPSYAYTGGSPTALSSKFNHRNYGKVNAAFAPNAERFHRACKGVDLFGRTSLPLVMLAFTALFSLYLRWSPLRRRLHLASEKSLTLS